MTARADGPMLEVESPTAGERLDNLDLDLHGKTWAEALEEFVDAYNRAVQPGGHACRTLTVIHGYGSTGSGGVLRNRFRRFFEKHQSRMDFTPGEKVSVNPGYTLVTPQYPLPGADAALSELVWDYCEQPQDNEQNSGPVPPLRRPRECNRPSAPWRRRSGSARRRKARTAHTGRYDHLHHPVLLGLTQLATKSPPSQGEG